MRNEKGRFLVKAKFALFVVIGLLGLSVQMPPAQSAEDTTAAQKNKTVMINRLYTGPDSYKLLATAGAELRRAPPGRVADWHTAPRRQYVITLSGHGELEISGGKKLLVGPGSIELVEDVTGKGHIT